MEFLTENSIDLDSGKEIIIKNFTNWTSGNEVIDDLIQEHQSEYDGYGKVFEWIPYSNLIDIKEIEKSDFSMAVWKEGPLNYDENENEWIRTSYEKVILRILFDSQNIIDEVLNFFNFDYNNKIYFNRYLF
jgi:hypothetical protein